MDPLPEVTPVLSVVPTAGPADWEAVYREHVVPVYRYVYARTGSRPDAEDVTAQVFLRSLPRLRLAASAGEVRGYLLTAARSMLAEHWAQRYGHPVDPLDDGRTAGRLPAVPPDEDDPLDPHPAERRATEVLGRLPDTYRRVLELRFLSGLTVRETAHEMGISVANAKVMQWRALRRAAALDTEASR